MEETPTPTQTVTRALLWAFGVCVILFLISAYALTIGWGPTHMSTFASANLPGVILTREAVGPVLAGLLVFFAFNAGFTGTLAPANAVARIVFAMARDRTIFPARFAIVDPVRRTPTRAIALLAAAGFIVTVLAGIALGPFTGFAVLAITSTVAHFVCHILVAISLPAYNIKQRHLNLIKHVLPAVIATVLIVTAFYLIMFPVKFPVELGPLLVLVWWLIGEWRLRHLAGTHPSLTAS